MFMCIKGTVFASVAEIFRLDVGTIMTVWYILVFHLFVSRV